MNQTEALKIMQTEKECVERQGTLACPNRDCENCDLLLPTEKVLEAYDVAIKVLERDWILLTTRPMTEDEKQHYIDIEKPEVAEYGEILACPLPDDGQEVLVSEGGIVCIDTFYHDDDCYFENANIDDVDAWQPLPKAFEKEDEYIFCNECEEHYTCSDAGGRDGCEFGTRRIEKMNKEVLDETNDEKKMQEPLLSKFVI